MTQNTRLENRKAPALPWASSAVVGVLLLADDPPALPPPPPPLPKTAASVGNSIMTAELSGAASVRSVLRDHKDPSKFAEFFYSNCSDPFLTGAKRNVLGGDGLEYSELEGIQVFSLAIVPRLIMDVHKLPAEDAAEVRVAKGQILLNGRPMRSVQVEAKNLITWSVEGDNSIALESTLQLEIAVRVGRMNSLAYRAWRAAGNSAVNAACKREVRTILSEVEQGYLDFE